MVVQNLHWASGLERPGDLGQTCSWPALLRPLTNRGGNQCRSPDFLGFSTIHYLLRGSWGGEFFVHLSFLLNERFSGCLKSHATIPWLELRQLALGQESSRRRLGGAPAQVAR